MLAFEFDLAADGWVALEWQGGDWQRWALQGPRGAEGSGALRESFSYWDSGVGWRSGNWQVPVRWLPAGHYSLQLSQGSGEARFNVRTMPLATPIATNTAISVNLAGSDPYELFDVVLDADSDVSFRGDAGASTGNHYRLYDVGGNLIQQGDPSRTNWTALSIPRDGHYLLAVARNAYGSLGGSALRFEFSEIPRTPQALALGVETQGTFVQGSQRNSYTFTVDAQTELVIKETVNGGTRNTYTLYDAWGSSVSQLSYSDSYTDRVYGIGPGTYTLRVQYAWSSTPATPAAYAFTTRVLPVGTAIGADGSAVVTWTQGVPDQQLQLSLEAGRTYWLAPTVAPTYYEGISYRIVDPAAKEVARGTLSGGWWSNQPGVSFTATVSGTYTVQLTGVNAGSGVGMSGTTTFNLQAGQRSVAAYEPNTTVEGTLGTPADEARQIFTLTEPTRLWLQTSGAISCACCAPTCLRPCCRTSRSAAPG
jgi:hypothetical protein